MTPKVSIIMPVFNAGRYLRTALDSVHRQTFHDFECICIDDGSTDNSLAIIEEYLARDERFRLIKGEHRCAGAARNVGLKMATGECLAFLDADDSFDPEFLREMCAAYDSADDVEIVVCSANLLSDGRTKSKCTSNCFLEIDRFRDGDFLNCTPGNPWNKLFASSLVRRMGFGFLELPNSEDVGFVFPALAIAKRIVAVEQSLVNYRIDNTQSLEHTKGSVDPLIFYDAYRIAQDRLKSLGVWERMRGSFLRRLGRAMLYNLKAPSSLESLNAVVDRIRTCAESDFGLLGDVPTEFDAVLLQMKGRSFDGYVLSRLRADSSCSPVVAIAMICDEGYVFPTVAAIRSILDHRSPEDVYDIRIVSTGLSESSRRLLRSFSVGHTVVRVIDADMNGLSGMHRFDSAAICVASEAALLKFRLPELLPDLQKVLYLDGDLIAREDVRGLFHTDVSGFCAAVVRDSGQMYYRHKYVKMFAGYFNSGVMVLNLALMREERLTERLIQIKRSSDDSSLMDQNVFNEVFCGRIRHLPIRWNFMPVSLNRADEKWSVASLNLLYGTSYENKRDVYDDAAIVHYSSKDKPWKSPDGAWAYVWNSYAQRTAAAKGTEISLSVVMPCYNVAPYVRATVESVLAQSSVSMEIICLDDGSTDGTLDALRSLAQIHPQVRIIANENHRQGWERNVGLREARGRYVHFMDADDLVVPDAYGKIVEYADRENLDIVMFEGESFYESAVLEERFPGYRSAYQRGCAYPIIYRGKDLYVLQRLNGDMIVSPCLQVFRRDFLQRERVYFPEDMSYMEDNLQSVSALLRARRVVCLTDVLFRRRVHDDSSMTTERSMVDREYCTRQVVEGLVSMASKESDPTVRFMLYRHALAMAKRSDGDASLSMLRAEIESCLSQLSRSVTICRNAPVKSSTVSGVFARMRQCYYDNGLAYTVRRILFGRQY